MATTTHTEVVNFIKDYEKYRKKAPSPLFSAIQYARLLVKKDLLGQRVGKKVVAGAKKLLTDARFALPTLTDEEAYNVPKVKKYFKNVVEPRERELMGQEDKPAPKKRGRPKKVKEAIKDNISLHVEKPKAKRGRPKKYEDDEERKHHKKISSAFSANKSKFKKALEKHNLHINEQFTLEDLVNYVLERPENFSKSVNNLANKIAGNPIQPKQPKEKKIPSVEKFRKAIPSGFAGEKTIEEMINYVLEKSSMFPKKVVNLAEKAYNDIRFKNVSDIATKEGFGLKEDAIKTYGMMLKHLEGHISDPKEPIDPKDYLQSKKLINSIKKIKTKGGELKGLPDYEHLKWGSFTKQFKAFKSSHPRVNSLEKFAEYVIRHKDKFHRKTLKRAYFYIDIIKKGDGITIEINDSSDSDSSSDSSDSEGENIILGNNINNKTPKSVLLSNIKNGENNFVIHNIMPHHPKGSKEAKDYMAKLRAMKGKGVRGSPSKTHKGEEDFTTKKGDKYHHRNHHLVNTGYLPYETEGGAILPVGHLANKLDFTTLLSPHIGLATTSMMRVPQSKTPRVINAGGIKPPPMLNTSKQDFLGVISDSMLGTAGNMFPSGRNLGRYIRSL